MLPRYLKVGTTINQSIFVKHRRYEYLANPLHIHPEIELLLVLKGTGTRIVGNSVEHFHPGTLIMIGPDVPHLWHFDDNYPRNNNTYLEFIYVLFKADIIREPFWQLPEARNVLKLIHESGRGIRLLGKTLKEVSSLMKSICLSSGFKRITILLSILEIISSGKEYQFLSSPVVRSGTNASDYERLDKVYNYMIDHFQDDISLKKAASIACFTIPSFCRYFKQRTNKTFTRFKNELRIAHACKLLSEEDKSVSEVCHISGFTNTSHFIQIFKKVTGYTPLNFQKKIVKGLRY